MKKNTLIKTIAVAMCAVSIFVGCGKSDSKSENKTDESVTEVTTEEETTEIKLEGEEVPAQLVTTQNVIDDNYRNYYEIFVASFCDSDGDGMGDIKGLISKLDYINDGDPNTDTDLGCNGIWLMPICPSLSYHKYDVMDYCDIDKAYGTLDDYKLLVEECHKRGIKIITDLVMNHSSIGHSWYKEARDYLASLPEGAEPNTADCKYYGYYNFSKGNPGGNYYSVGVGDYYYEAVFSQNMPELNLADVNLQNEFKEITKFWLDMGTDGFRLDAAKEYYSGNTPGCVEVLTWLNEAVKDVNPNAYIVAETWTSDYYSYLESGIDSAFDFGYSSFDGNIALVTQDAVSTYNGRYFADCLVKSYGLVKGCNADGIMSTFLGNHDLNRIAHLLGFNPEKIKFANGLLSIMNGNTFIYYGDEIGIGGTGADENKRSPMIWSSTDKTGQCNGPVNSDSTYIINKFESVENQEKDATSILSYVKAAEKLRNTFPEISRGVPEVISEVSDENVCALLKTYNDSKVVILANTSSTEKAYATVSMDKYGYTCIKGILTVGDEQPKQVGETIVLPPYSVVVLQ